jgi:DNA-directed RNA polymerase I subunit RPA1
MSHFQIFTCSYCNAVFAFLQNELARAESHFICNNDNQYIVPTSGNPLRGLIQDHIACGVKLTCRDTFLTREEFMQLLYVACSGLPGTEIVPVMDELIVPAPAIIKPRPLWTGKQVVSALLQQMCKPPLPPLNLDAKARTPAAAFGAIYNEHVVIFRHGELLCGVLDKNAVGNTAMGIVHAVYELYGADLAGKLLTAFGRVFTYFLQAFAGLSCGIEDLTLRPSAEVDRRRLLDKVTVDARAGLVAFLSSGGDGNDPSAPAAAAASGAPSIGSDGEADRVNKECSAALEDMLRADWRGTKVRIDAAMQAVVNKSASDVIKACLPHGLDTPFPRNNFSLMVSSGAKGSAVNQSQISCFLGQQALEGQRVPIMISGKTLPSFRAFDGSARAGGFISDRFVTGVKPQEYYFHCMAGREGLVDTAVKTSRSGYLQRCLVKHLEELKVNYDYTVRDSGGNVIQFLYGEDGLDPVEASLLGGSAPQLEFLSQNFKALLYKYGAVQSKAVAMESSLEGEGAEVHHRAVRLARRALQTESAASTRVPGTSSEAPSAAFANALKKKLVVLARRRRNADFGWSRGNLLKKWFVAEVVKVRRPEDASEHDPSAALGLTCDLKYEDGAVDKRVPLLMRVKSRTVAMTSTEGGVPIAPLIGPQGVFIPLIKPGLPDPAMASLPLGNTVGAISEKFQADLEQFREKNADGGQLGVISGEELELLVSIKYMRALACPGEAVGCVAAQSIGEPSTQMTLNTFHLAGHGGANVTLGIPRLREIIMTASKNLKTPTMLLPLVDSRGQQEARELARKLSKLSVSELIHHRKGIEVGESIRKGPTGIWYRQYRVRFNFEPAAKIAAAFGVSFDDLIACVSSKVRSALVALKNRESRRASGIAASAANAVEKFAERPSKGFMGGKSSSGGDEDDGGDAGSDSGGRAAQRDVAPGLDDDEGEVDDEELEQAEEDEEAGAGRRGRKGASGDVFEYEADESEEEEGDDAEGGAGVRPSGADQSSSGGEEEEEEEVGSSGAEEEQRRSKKAAASKDAKKKAKKVTLVEVAEQQKGSKSGRPAASSSKKAAVATTNEYDACEAESWIELKLRFPVSERRYLMLQLAEEASKKASVRVTSGISRAHVVQCADSKGVADAGVGVMTEGVNFEEAWMLSEQLCRHCDISTNDIAAMLVRYGVEAARECIVKEIKGVFGVYGINVNIRHLGLIADFMTRGGEFTPMNRAGMWECPSPFQQMSFETTCTFLTQAAQDGSVDRLESPSARIVAGSAPRVGTGCFELMMPLN